MQNTHQPSVSRKTPQQQQSTTTYGVQLQLQGGGNMPRSFGCSFSHAAIHLVGTALAQGGSDTLSAVLLVRRNPAGGGSNSKFRAFPKADARWSQVGRPTRMTGKQHESCTDTTTYETLSLVPHPSPVPLFDDGILSRSWLPGHPFGCFCWFQILHFAIERGSSPGDGSL